MRRRWLLVIITFAIVLVVIGLVARLIGRESHTYVRFANPERTYLMHVPPSYKGTQPAPLVVVLHGAPSDAQAVEQESGFSKKADEAGFLVVYPNGNPMGRRKDKYIWNSGGTGTMAPFIDDVQYLRSLLRRLQHQYKIDPKRIYVVGMSNGGMMAHRVGCEASDMVAAIASVAGTLNVPCPTGSPLPVIMVHGMKDDKVSYTGKTSRLSWNIASVPDSVQAWVKRNQCQSKPIRTEKGNIIITHYLGATPRSDVVLYTVKDGKHEWPRRASTSTTPEFSATDVIWDFFAQHPKP